MNAVHGGEDKGRLFHGPGLDLRVGAPCGRRRRRSDGSGLFLFRLRRVHYYLVQLRGGMLPKVIYPLLQGREVLVSPVPLPQRGVSAERLLPAPVQPPRRFSVRLYIHHKENRTIIRWMKQL